MAIIMVKRTTGNMDRLCVDAHFVSQWSIKNRHMVK